MAEQEEITIVLVDDHEVLREALREKLNREPGLRVVGEARDASGALEVIGELKPSVLILDVTLKHESGIDVAIEAARISSATRILAYSMHTEKAIVLEMLKAGALGYVSKVATKTDLLNAIRAIAEGKTYLCAETSRVVVDSLSGEEEAESPLSAREREVLRLLAEGRRSFEIAEALFISVSTVEVHRRNIMRKLDLHNSVELTRYAIRAGITTV